MKKPTQIQLRFHGGLKDDLRAAIEKHGGFANMTDFFTACATAFVLDMRAGRTPAFPLEFLPKRKR